MGSIRHPRAICQGLDISAAGQSHLKVKQRGLGEEKNSHLQLSTTEDPKLEKYKYA